MTSIYNAGTVTVTNGSAAVVGAGTAWAVSLVTGGLFTRLGVAIPILSVTDDTHLTLAYPWPGATAAAAAYAIDRENSSASNIVDLYDKLTRVLLQLSLAGITPNNSGTLAKRNALTLGAGDDNYLYLHAEIGVAFAFYRWDGPSLAWVGPFSVANAVATGGVSSIVQGTGVTVDSTNPAIPIIKLANMANATIKGRTTAGTGAPEDLTMAQVKALLLAGVVIREVLTANRTYFVRPDGNNANTGLVNSAGGAFLTPQKAWDTVAGLDLSIYAVTIQIADGTYTAGMNMSAMPLGGSGITIQGNTGTPTNCFINATTTCFLTSAPLPCPVVIQGFRLAFTGSGLSAIRMTAPGTITTAAIVLAGGSTGFAGAFNASERGSRIIVSTGLTVAGNMSGLCAVDGGVIQFFAITVTLTGTPAFSWTTMSATSFGLIAVAGVTFSGAATGVRYSCLTAGGINTGGGGASFIPGNSAGSAASPGWYL
ncbi:MAG: hypothetical protein EOR12_16790 [Mesorhizobium sp.]|uniref:hypothetical protein n=1 Tax=Mesorhizobium sp. TaxID=1871066 RepID=UPI000FE911A5|nr:hypothetical protein [Mesorhizobium sp.]RWP88368.1 MAG: hypothetical protein EOR12_16790 [Mesorhizobium sp.]